MVSEITTVKKILAIIVSILIVIIIYTIVNARSGIKADKSLKEVESFSPSDPRFVGLLHMRKGGRKVFSIRDNGTVQEYIITSGKKDDNGLKPPALFIGKNGKNVIEKADAVTEYKDSFILYFVNSEKKIYGVPFTSNGDGEMREFASYGEFFSAIPGGANLNIADITPHVTTMGDGSFFVVTPDGDFWVIIPFTKNVYGEGNAFMKWQFPSACEIGGVTEFPGTGVTGQDTIVFTNKNGTVYVLFYYDESDVVIGGEL